MIIKHIKTDRCPFCDTSATLCDSCQTYAANKESPAEALSRWECEGMAVPSCEGCAPFYRAVERGEMPYSIMEPRHIPSDACQSGSKPHCTCDACF